MELGRRKFLHLAAATVALPALSRPARSESFPARPMRLVVGYAAGGVNDILARIVGQSLSEQLGQSFVIENKAGAGSNIATETVVRSQPDGYTLLLASAANAINATLYDKLNFDFIRDVAPVAGISQVSNVMVVKPTFPAKSVAEFIAYAKAHPDKITMASAGIGSPQHVGGELFKMMTGIKMVHVPYRGGAPAITDLLGGQVDVYFASSASSIEYIRTGKLKALGVTSLRPSEALPDVPTIGEFVPGYEASAWYGVGVPRKTPADIIEKLNKAINAALADSKLLSRLADLGATPLVGSPDDFGKFIAEETTKWGNVVKFATIKPE